MKKALLIFITLSYFTLAAESFIDENKIFIKNGKAYFLSNETQITGTVMKKNEGTTVYSTYKNGIKTKEKVLNSNREVISEYTYDSNGLINGKVLYADDYGTNIETNYKNGIVDGFVSSKYYGDIDFEGNFSYGVAHGKAKVLNMNYDLEEKVFSNGVNSKIIESFKFSPYLANVKYVSEDSIKLTKNKMYSNNQLFTGLAFKSSNNYIVKGTYYKSGDKKAYFEFDNGFMKKAMLYSDANSYTQYDFNAYNYMQGIVYTITGFVNGVENGAYVNYYPDGWRFEGTFKDGKLIDVGYYFNEKNEIKEVHEYLDDTYKSTLYFDYNKKIVEGKVEGKKVNDYWIKTGKAIYYNVKGYVEEEIVYDGEKGYMKFYYENGKLQKEGYVNAFSNYYEGEIKEYYESGILKAKYNYVNGYLDGIQYYYDENGVQNKTEKYDYGYLLDNDNL